MRTAAVICELNPLHNGHAFLFSEAKRLGKADFLIAIMSGNFVQRGEPAVFDKFLRAEMALLAGADLVLELPPVFSMSSAREFARAGVMTAEKTGVTDILAFGAEGLPSHASTASQTAASAAAKWEKTPCTGADGTDTGFSTTAEPGTAESEAAETASNQTASNQTASDHALLRQLQAAAKSLPEIEADAFQAVLRQELKKGKSYPKARMDALRAQRKGAQEETEADAVFALPNNLLAIEYLRALHAGGSGITPLAIQRRGDGYHTVVPGDTAFTSATALRSAIFAEQDAQQDHNSRPGMLKTFLANYCPKAVLPIYEKALSGSLGSVSLLGPLLNQRILEISSGRGRFADFTAYSDMSPALSDRLMRNAGHITGFSGRVQQLKTRQYTQTRITRALLHVVVGLEAQEIEREKNAGYVRYLRILGFRRSAALLLAELKKNASVPIVTKPAAHKELIAQDVYYDQLYYALLADGDARVRGEYERSPVIRSD